MKGEEGGDLGTSRTTINGHKKPPTEFKGYLVLAHHSMYRMSWYLLTVKILIITIILQMINALIWREKSHYTWNDLIACDAPEIVKE